MTRNVIIIGVGGYSANLIDMMRDLNAASQCQLWRPIGFLDDEPSRRGSTYYGLPILAGLNEASRFNEAHFINAIGSPKSAEMKPELIARTGIPADRFITLCHPSAWVSPSATLGIGTVITQQCVVMAGAILGMHVKTLPLSTISYGARIGDFTTVAGGAVIAAEVQIGRSGYIGANSAIRERVTLGDVVVVGMGAMVIADVPSQTMVVGAPARPLRAKDPGAYDPEIGSGSV